jgi:epoxyqueuosine reductase QueG
VLDARRCISYLTIEHRGDVDPALHAGIGEWQFGCDVCQSVCPWNRKAPVTREPAFLPAGPFPGADAIADMTDDEIRQRFTGTALLRPKPAGLRRNAAIALANRQAELDPRVHVSELATLGTRSDSPRVGDRPDTPADPPSAQGEGIGEPTGAASRHRGRPGSAGPVHSAADRRP